MNLWSFIGFASVARNLNSARFTAISAPMPTRGIAYLTAK